MNLYLAHCGYYDKDIADGINEFHVNLHVAADSLEKAKQNVRLNSLFMDKKMHIDGLQEVRKVSGFRIELVNDDSN